MLKEYKHSLVSTFRLGDLLTFPFAFHIAHFLMSGQGPSILQFPMQYPVFFSTYLVAWIYLSNHFQLYASKRLISFRHEVWDVSKTTALCVIIATIPAFSFRSYPLSHLLLLYLWLIQTGGLILFRFILRATLRYIRRRGYNFRQVLVVGRNSRAAKLARKIEATPEFGLRILGFIDAHDNGNGSTSSYEFNLIGDLQHFEKILTEHVVDEVFVTLPVKTFYEDMENIVRHCERVGVEAKIPIDLFKLSMAKSTTSLYGDIELICFYTGPKMNWHLGVKRLIDLVTASALLVLSLPLFALVSALIKATSKGPIFFRQQRVGYNGRLFNLLKFRTMVENAEVLKKDLTALNEMDGPVFKIGDDPRITKLGRFLRKTSMDELPQLINVLKGEMSLVGPRPPLPEEVSQYDLTHRRRLSMKPGITCVWQVNGRNSITFEKWMELDMEYIDRWSLWLDIKLLFKTIPAVLWRSGAG